MSGAKQYEDAQRRNGIDAVHLAMRTLREHWENVSITCHRTDGEGCVQSYELEFDPDEDDEEEKA
jgi:hypothetical protein